MFSVPCSVQNWGWGGGRCVSKSHDALGMYSMMHWDRANPWEGCAREDQKGREGGPCPLSRSTYREGSAPQPSNLSLPTPAHLLPIEGGTETGGRGRYDSYWKAFLYIQHAALKRSYVPTKWSFLLSRVTSKSAYCRETNFLSAE